MKKIIFYSKQLFYVGFLLCMSMFTFAQYAPPVGQTGTTAIHADSNIFVEWAIGCDVEKGYADISNTNLGWATYGLETVGTGKADNIVVSLGDGGVATLTFNTPISDGAGWDFAVFENSFLDDFLELAFVEVSSNGVDYHRFNSISVTQQDTQVGTFGLVNTTKIHNLAGKYKTMYGTPFDLNELKDISGLDISNIVSVRIIDVVGSIDTNYATYDSNGNIINDPWPTPFESGGFDIDAVGVINNRDNTSGIDFEKNISGIIFPNPAHDYFNISLSENIDKVIIQDLSGKYVVEFNDPSNKYFHIDFLPSGYYIVKILTHGNQITTKLIKN